MRIVTLAGTRSQGGEPPRATAYYYADLERLKRRNRAQDADEPRQSPDELGEYVEANEAVDDGAVQEVPPLRDRAWSPPAYSAPAAARKPPEETYSTAGTFPMPEPKEKEPLLAELEAVGRLPLTQLETAPGVRRSRSWYLCCPNVADEEISRESSWRYSSLRPVTAPPLPGQNGILVVTQSNGQAEDPAALRAERDALVRALAAERQRAAAAARAHDARLAELHGVIAELVRRRAADKHTRAIPEEEVSDECESTTQPAGELERDADLSRTEPNDSSSAPSPPELPELPELPAPPAHPALPDDSSDTSTQEIHIRVEQPAMQASVASGAEPSEPRFDMSERDSEICVSTARCCQYARGHPASTTSCERERGSGMLPASPGRCESRQAKLASRVRLRRTEDADSSHLINDEAWCAEAAARLALDVCAQAELREALAAVDHDEEALCGAGCAGAAGAGAAVLWRARCVRLAADCRVLDCALARAVDTAHRVSSACARQESCAVALCGALAAADRALEAYDVLLALAETAAHPPDHPERAAAELVAARLLRRLRRAPAWGEPLLSPGPWHELRAAAEGGAGGGSDAEGGAGGAGERWGAAQEARLRRLAARLKRDTVRLRRAAPPPRLYSPHDADETGSEGGGEAADGSAADMEAAVLLQEELAAREARVAARLAALAARPAHPAQPAQPAWPPAQPETAL